MGPHRGLDGCQCACRSVRQPVKTPVGSHQVPARQGARGAVGVPRASGEAGQTLAEFAVTLFVLMLLIMGIVDFSRAVYAQAVVANAAREGARYGAVNPEDLAGMASRAMALVTGLDRTHLEVVPSADATRVQVEVRYTFHPVTVLIGRILGGGPDAGITLRSRSSMRRE